jgi:hypothetical protein
MNQTDAEWTGKPFGDLLVVPRGFVELHCVPSGSLMHVRVDEVAAYGPEHRDGSSALIGIPVQLRGATAGEATLTAHGMREFANLCMWAEQDLEQHKRYVKGPR